MRASLSSWRTRISAGAEQFAVFEAQPEDGEDFEAGAQVSVHRFEGRELRSVRGLAIKDIRQLLF